MGPNLETPERQIEPASCEESVTEPSLSPIPFVPDFEDDDSFDFDLFMANVSENVEGQRTRIKEMLSQGPPQQFLLLQFRGGSRGDVTIGTHAKPSSPFPISRKDLRAMFAEICPPLEDLLPEINSNTLQNLWAMEFAPRQSDIIQGSFQDDLQKHATNADVVQLLEKYVDVFGELPPPRYNSEGGYHGFATQTRMGGCPTQREMLADARTGLR